MVPRANSLTEMPVPPSVLRFIVFLSFLSDDPEQTLGLPAAAEGSPSEQALRRLEADLASSRVAVT
jgi:hypothetical protein